MKKILIAVILLISGCSSLPQRQSLTDKEIANHLQGVWCASNDGGKTCFGYDHVIDGSRVESCEMDDAADTPTYVTANYRISNNEICYEVSSSNNPMVLSVGEKFCDVVLRIDEKTETYKFSDEDQIYTSYKRPGMTFSCPPSK